jgi:hypothetical protein
MLWTRELCTHFQREIERLPENIDDKWIGARPVYSSLSKGVKAAANKEPVLQPDELNDFVTKWDLPRFMTLVSSLGKDYRFHEHKEILNFLNLWGEMRNAGAHANGADIDKKPLPDMELADFIRRSRKLLPYVNYRQDSDTETEIIKKLDELKNRLYIFGGYDVVTSP